MNKQVIIGFSTEGTTDFNFLESIVQRSFEETAFECSGPVEILPVQYLKKPAGDFIEMVRICAWQADAQGIMVLCIHTDADSDTDTNAFEHKITPAFAAVEGLLAEGLCKNLVAVVPVQMTEAWLLADSTLLKDEIGTAKGDEELGIHKNPESYADPKQIIENAIRIARQDMPRRRRNELALADLYAPLGQKIALRQLERLASYIKFKKAVRGAFTKLSYLR
jgi:hypothetical protein